MTDRGPFQMDHDPGREMVETMARTLLAACDDMADRQMAGKPVIETSGIPGASVLERSVVSIALQAIWNAAVDAKLQPFNVLDGVAHAIATTLAQYPPEGRDVGLQILFRNIPGYEARTRAALARPDEVPQ